MIDFTLFTFTLLSVATSAICTTAIIDKVIFGPLLNDRWYEEDFDRSIKAHSLFFFLDGVFVITMLVLTAEAWVPFIITIMGWSFSAVSYYFNRKIVDEMATVGTENSLRRSNIIRSVLWLGKFVCLFSFCLELVYRDL